MAFQKTTTIKKLLAMTARKKIIQGGTSAGKTYGIIPVLIDKACRKGNMTITVVAETLPAVKTGALRIFLQIMEETGRWNEDSWNASNLTYKFANKTIIEFKSFDTKGKAKNGGKRHILFLNEANHIDKEIADMLITRSNDIWIDFNPDAKFWAHDILTEDPNSEFLLLTYKDNEGVPPEVVEELMMKQRKAFFDPEGDWNDENNIKSAYWANWCRVYIAGEIGQVEGTIITDYEVVNTIPPQAELIGYGTDFGKGGSDPTTTTAVYYYDGLIYWDQIVYEVGLRDSTHAERLKEAGVDPTKVNACDNSEPTKILELQLRGFPKAKGYAKETIEYGIGLLQRHPVRITSRSEQILNEVMTYKRGEDGKPKDKNNHAIDGIRYLYVALMSAGREKPKKRGGYKSR